MLLMPRGRLTTVSLKAIVKIESRIDANSYTKCSLAKSQTGL